MFFVRTIVIFLFTLFCAQADTKPSLSEAEKEYLASKGSIKMCADPDWMPFESIKEGKLIGMSAEYLNVISKNLNLDFELVPTKTWSESIEYAKARKCDIYTLAMKTEARERYMNFTSPYLVMPLVLVTKSDAPFIFSLGDLNGKKVSIIKGYAFEEILRDRYKNIDLLSVNSLEEGFESVEDGEAFGFISALGSVAYAFQKEYTGELKINGKFDENWELGIGVRNDEHMLLEILQKGVDSIKESDSSDIFNKWIAIKYEHGVDYTLVWQIVVVSIVLIVGFLLWNRKLRMLNSDLKKAQDSMQEALKMAEEQKEIAQMATKTKSLFLASISHEIRTPMNALNGMLALLEESNLSPKQAEYVKNIKLAAGIPLRLLNDLLDFSKLEAGKFSLEKNIFEIESVLGSVYEIFSQSAKDKGLELRKECIGTKQKVYIGDSLRISQVLTNLLSNAIKFTQNGSVLVKATLSSEGEKTDIVLFSVKDSGVGIPKDRQDFLFDIYAQADSSTARKYGGTGLGLAISKELVNAMGGKIWFKSSEGEGSEFMFELPLERTDKKEKLKSTLSDVKKDKKVKKATFKNTKLLLVEDNELNQELIKSLLEGSNIEITLAKNGVEAISALERDSSFDIILMDVQMPIMDGVEASTIIKQKDDLKHIPIVALSANGYKKDSFELQYMDDYLQKPIEIEKFYTLLASILEHKVVFTKDAQKESGDIGEKNENHKHIDTDLGKSYMLDNPEKYDEILGKFYDRFVGFGDEVKEVFETNPSELKELLHSLKGLSATIGATKLSETCERVRYAPNIDNLKAFLDELNAVMMEIKQRRG